MASRPVAQMLDLRQGLRQESVGTIDFGGYIPWSSVETFTGLEGRTVALLEKRDFISAAKLARQCVDKGPGRLVAHSLLLQATIGQRDLKKLDALVDSYRQGGTKPRLVAEQIAYARALAFKTGNLPASTAADWQRADAELAYATSRLDPQNVAQSIAVADTWSSSEMGRFSKARKIMEDAVKASPSSVAARYFLLVQYDKGVLASNDPAVKIEKPRPDLVVRQAEAIIGLDPRFRQAYYFGGLARLQNGDRAGAAGWLKKYRDLNPYKKGEYYDNAGKVLKTLGAS